MVAGVVRVAFNVAPGVRSELLAVGVRFPVRRRVGHPRKGCSICIFEAVTHFDGGFYLLFPCLIQRSVYIWKEGMGEDCTMWVMEKTQRERESRERELGGRKKKSEWGV